MAVFYAELHGLDARDMEAAGAAPIEPWLRPEEILRRAWPVLPPELRLYADLCRTNRLGLAAATSGPIRDDIWLLRWARLEYGVRSHDQPAQRRVCDLTARIVAEYEALTGLALDPQRIHLLSGVLRLSELAELADDADHAAAMVRAVAAWAAR